MIEPWRWTLAETKLSASALRNTPENAHRIAALVSCHSSKVG